MLVKLRWTPYSFCNRHFKTVKNFKQLSEQKLRQFQIGPKKKKHHLGGEIFSHKSTHLVCVYYDFSVLEDRSSTREVCEP